MKLETLAIHYGQEPDSKTGAITAPIYNSTTYERDPDGEYSRGYVYSRDGNPNRNTLEQLVAKMEGGVAAAAFSSGMAAITACIQALEHGDHILFPDDLYFGVRHLVHKVFKRWGLQYSFVDMGNLNSLKRQITNKTKMIWIESPSNPLIKIADLAAVSEVAHSAGAVCVCDNTWPTPVLQQPFQYGVDIIIHSSTKYFGGHSDVMGGLVVTKDENELFRNVRDIQQEAGAVPSPFDCWLITRGMQTLSCRIKAQSDSAFELANFLDNKDGVENVFYPGLPHHPGHEIAQKQMKKFGAMMSFTVGGGAREAMHVTSKLKFIKHATSLGGTHTLVEHRESVEGKDTLAPPNLLRLSIGLENTEDLIEDLARAIDTR